MSGDHEEEEAAGETLEEAGHLEADVGARFDQQLANIDPRLSIGMDPQAHHNLRPEMMFIREELRQAKMQTLAVGRNSCPANGEKADSCQLFYRSRNVRRMALKKLLLKDLMQEDCELRNIGLAYALRYP